MKMSWPVKIVKTFGWGCAAVFCAAILIIVFAIFILPRVLPHNCISQEAGKWKMSCSIIRPLRRLMWANDSARESGRDWIDPATCTNSIQFVQALCEKFKDDTGGYSCDFGLYAKIWCVAINPPKDDNFPLIFTCNIDPRELLSQTEVDRSLTLTCPKTWGGSCFNFCENAAVIIGGPSWFLKRKYLCPKFIFHYGIPKPNPNTYFLTPTGRVDLVEGKGSASQGQTE